MTYSERLHNAANYIESKCGKAEIAVILGSGLGDYAGELENATVLPYSEIPGFPVSTVPGHAGMWHCGSLHSKQVYMMQGRFHAYEGWSMEDVTMPIRVMKLLGVKNVILTNAAGGVDLSFTPGDLMLITDHINLSGKNPLIGANLDEFGPRFPDMTYSMSRKLQGIARESAAENGIDLKEGIYAWLNGPCFETPAEIRMLRMLGVNATGMSTVPEIIAGVHCGMEIMGISCITNMASGILDQPLTHQEVMETGLKVRDKFRNLVDGIIKKL